MINFSYYFVVDAVAVSLLYFVSQVHFVTSSDNWINVIFVLNHFWGFRIHCLKATKARNPQSTSVILLSHCQDEIIVVLYFQSAPCSILAEVKEHEIVFNFKAVIKISHTSLSNWHQFYVPNIAVYFKDWICFQQIQSKRRNWHSFEALPHYHIHTHTLDQVSMQLLGCLLSNACGKLILA